MAAGQEVTNPRVIWDRARNPTKHVSNALQIERWQLRAAIHKIKATNDLAATDRVIIYSDRKVTDDRGAEIGNIYDET